MDARTFLGLEATEDPLRFRLPLRLQLLTPGNFLFGGCGLAAAVEAMEAATGRPLIWATAQYLSYATMPSTLDLQVTLAVSGNQISQARCTATAGGREIITVNAALGRRDFDGEGQWAVRPDVPAPADCPSRPVFDNYRGTIIDAMELREARGRSFSALDGTPGDGTSALWIRLPGGRRPVTAGDLAILGDHLPSGIGQALGRAGGGNSLDNTIRVVRLVPSEWCLLDIRVHAVANGFAHGLVHIWAEDGTLLATASQSSIVRLWDPAATP